MFHKILIANRGEIAVRVARTARRLGITSVAVYSDADKNALHVEVCDEAYHIGGAAASESYLDGARILEVARLCAAEAIHPGYGFLSENADFARTCEQAGIVFIGPPASAIDAMGSKSQAKALMQGAGVPLIPGYHGDDQSDESLATESQKIGYPQLIKASAGGGGKGMRLVESEKEFSDALVSARREASASFGDDKVLIERYLTRPRHVEMQIFADARGNCVHLFERDCSIQRRHQKVIEEAPAPGVDEELRNRMGEAATNCATAIDYIGAGTVEFLLDEDGSFYFMEMNTRLQVEHPVSEMITGQDLVEWQLRVAAGQDLPLAQNQISRQGHAVEARIYAENPQQDFMPAAGQIRYLQLPPQSHAVRVDTGVRNGDMIGINYDPMIAKLIVHAPEREAAFALLAAALQQYQVLGLQTNIGFLVRLAKMPELIDGDFDTGFISRHAARLFAADPKRERQVLLLAGAALLPAFDDRDSAGQSPWESRALWRMNLPAKMKLALEYENQVHDLLLSKDQQGWSIELGGKSQALSGAWIDRQRMRVELDEEIFEFSVLEDFDTIAIGFDGDSYRFQIGGRKHGSDSSDANADHPLAPMSGTVVALPVAVGDTVEPGDILVVIEAMKMEHSIVAQVSARIGEILFSVGDQVEEGDTLVLLEVD